MSKWGSTDFKQLQDLRDKLAKFEKMDMRLFCEKVSKELAARLLRQVIPNTPVGQYPASTGKVGGTLRRGWTARTEAEAASGMNKDVASYAAALPVALEGNTYVITIINPVHYASYVEYGHRQEVGRYVPAIGKRLKNGWVKGRFMLTKAEAHVEGKAQKIIEKKLLEILGETLK